MKKKACIIVGVVTAFLIITGVMLSKKLTNKNTQDTEIIGKIEETQEESDIQALGEWEDLSANWDPARVSTYTDPTGRTAPVPIGFTASSVESESYVNGVNVEKKGIITDLTWTTSGTYPWTQNSSDNIWQSGNYDARSTTSELMSDEIEVGANGGYLSLEWSVSSRSASGLLSVTITNTVTGETETPTNLSGTGLGTNYSTLVYT